MKKTTPSFLIAFAAMLVLAMSGAAIAQQDMGNLTGGTFTVGIVDTFGDNSLTLKKDNGELTTIMLGDMTVGKKHLANGARVRVDYEQNDQGQPIAKVIQINAGTKVAVAPVVETEAQVAVETTPAPAPADTYKAEPAPSAPVEPTAPAVTEPAPSAPEALPATASSMPTFALLGLLAFAGGLAVRVAR